MVLILLLLVQGRPRFLCTYRDFPFLFQEDTRQKLVVSDNKVRQLETQVHLEKQNTENGVKVIRQFCIEYHAALSYFSLYLA